MVGALIRARSALFEVVHTEMQPDIAALVSATYEALVAGGRLLFCGNGGSAADAQHLAAEYIGVGLPALALTTDTSVLTAVGNDFGYDEVFARQIQALARPVDLLVMHSTSGESRNLIYAAEQARSDHMRTVALLAKGGGRLCGMVDLVLVVPTESTPLAQEVHLAIGHIVFELIAEKLCT